MNYEKRCNELIDAIKEMMEANPHDEGLQNWVHDNVPELTESEDERIRKEFCEDIWTFIPNEKAHKYIVWLEKQVSIDKEKMLIGARKDVASSIITYLDRNTLGMCLSNMECEDLVNAVVDSDWSKVYDYMKKKLEKQGDKPQGKTVIEAIKEEKVDNRNCATVEPKFQNGQWVVWQNKCYKVNYNGCGYELVDQNGLSTSLEYGTIDENARLWTIEDVKDGDLLYIKYNKYEYKYEWIIIFKHLNPEEHIMDYCSYCINGTFYSDSNPWGKLSETDTVYPATKEQCDLLFSKIKENGYWWNAKNKILKKIES